MLFFAACTNAQDLQYTITGKLDNFSPMPEKIYFIELMHTGVLAKSLDSSEVKNGEYHFSGKLLADQATIIQITTTPAKKADQTQEFALMVDKGDFRVVSEGSLSHSAVTGTGALAQHQFEEMMAPVKALADSINAEKKAEGYENDKALQQRVLARSGKVLVQALSNMYNYAKQHPKELNYGSVGVGSSQHLAGAYFEQLTGTQLVHIPYRNIANYTPDFISGQVPVGFQLLPNVLGLIKSGDARALAVAGNKRMTALPDVPTAAEAGLQGYESSAWLALLAPANMDQALVDKLYAAAQDATKDPKVRALFAEQGAEPTNLGPEDLKKFMASEILKWSEVIGKMGIAPM